MVNGVLRSKSVTKPTKNSDDMQPTPTGSLGYHSLQVPLRPFADLRPEDRVECYEVSSALNQVLWGKYLLCQTISTSRHHGDAIEVVVTDPKGATTMRLALNNYSTVEKSMLELNFDEIVPPGSFLALKNPCWASTGGESFMLHCYNPKEVELLSLKALESKFPDLQWRGPIKRMVINDENRNFWGGFEGYEAAFEKLKRLGYNGFGEKRYSDAIRFYDMALDYCDENREEEAIIHSNKSAALLALGCFNSALKSAEAALEVDPGNKRYNYRKAKALIGLGKYEEGKKFLEEAFDQFSSLNKSKGCKKLWDNVKFLCLRKNLGPTESQLLSLLMQTLEDDAKIPDFTGPVEISKIEGKGRGLVATQDIHPGQLVMVTKAFGLCGCTPLTSKDAKSVNFSQEQLAGKIANKLTFDPELGPRFYNLTAGAERGHLEPGDEGLDQVDMGRILEIVKFNSFASRTGDKKNPGKEIENWGVWILPSFFNHNCSEHNCSWDICGEWFVVRAIAEIKKGEELTLAYKSPVDSYEERQAFFNIQGFICNCKLCQFEAREPNSVKNERAKILQSLNELTPNLVEEEMEVAFEGFEKLVSLRSDDVALNFPLLSPQVIHMMNILFEKGRHGDAIPFLCQMFDVASASVCWAIHGINMAVNLIFCHAGRGDKELTKLWMDDAKELMTKFYGHLEPMRLNAEIVVELVKQQFGIDFFADD